MQRPCSSQTHLGSAARSPMRWVVFPLTLCPVVDVGRALALHEQELEGPSEGAKEGDVRHAARVTGRTREPAAAEAPDTLHVQWGCVLHGARCQLGGSLSGWPAAEPEQPAAHLALATPQGAKMDPMTMPSR